MKFIYACDIHGDINKYKKLMRLAMENNIDYIVAGGDLLPKWSRIREPVQRRFIWEEFDGFFSELKKHSIQFIGILGNDDLEAIEEDYYNMIQEYPNVHDVDNNKADIEDVCFIGLNKVLDHPFSHKDHITIEEGQKMPIQSTKEIYINKTQDYITVEEWKKNRELIVPKMEECLEKLPNPTEGKKTIYIFHDPPYGIGLDYCRDGDRPGSKAITTFLKNSDAYMSLHGHIHESPEISGIWKANLGKTVCIQPGQTEYNNVYMKYVIIDTDQNKFVLKTDIVV